MIDPNAIAALKVYPPIGVARVGNAQGADDYVIGPELIGGAPSLPGTTPEQPARFVEDFRTANGEIKRQAARFRIYAHIRTAACRR
ncbi:LodA/GoxA family CTQ-dependent oxidase [Bradyrhizobium sp. 521_C7_N1_3]|uniref:LodA/GoxA family CTQ-dependent oxidase n=1 Tax=Bradyrhizobium sp. 521_C7_N1_3 TaxID=3240368 RepID=UPI003F8C3E22